MAPTILQSALSEFEGAIDELAANATFICTAIRLRPRLGSMLDWANKDATTFGQNFIKQKDADEALLLRGLLVLLAGTYEEFIRHVLRDGVSAINKGITDYSTIGEKIRKNNMHWTGAALQTIHEPKDYLDLDYEELAKNLGTCFSGSAQFILNSQAFSLFLSIISPASLVTAFGRIDIDLSWDQLAKTKAIRDALDKQETREAAKALQDFLQEFSKNRNKIAHAGGSSVVVLESDFASIIKVFRIFARSLAVFVEAEVGKAISQSKVS